ncbi:MAG: DNA gyrase inhibitor YacG [Planctomycetaceae bacterium]|nr:DNA gyrase inhibitor YacG [Planctomycetaceae bacterium]
MICPVCEKTFDENDAGQKGGNQVGGNTALPFCSMRCKRIDAARWLDERYACPMEKKEADDFSEHESVSECPD